MSCNQFQLTKHSRCRPCHHLSDNVPCDVTPVGGDSVALGHVQCHCILWQWLAQQLALHQRQLCTAQWGSRDSRTHSETGVMYTGAVHKGIMH